MTQPVPMMSAAECDDFLLSNLSEVSNPEPAKEKNAHIILGLADHPSIPNVVKPA